MSPEARNLLASRDAAGRIAVRLRESLRDLGPVLPVSADRIEALDSSAHLHIDAFLKRFEQMQDVLSNRLVRALLLEAGADVTGMTARDAYDRAEGLGALADAARFMGIHQLRNRLAHEYPMEDERRAARINDAFAAAPALLEEFERLSAYAGRFLGNGDGT